LAARVLHLFTCLRHRLRLQAVGEAQAVANKGFQYCAHGRPDSKRQVLLMDSETLEAMGLAPGWIKENVTTRGLDVQGLVLGQQLRIGEALMEVTLPCEPCGQMNNIRPGLEEELRGRRGKLCRVVDGGLVKVGDAIELLERRAAGG
jgi:MOSC domain-containing protein YiiM